MTERSRRFSEVALRHNHVMVHVSKRSTRRPSLLQRIEAALVMDAQPWWDFDSEQLQRLIESRMK